MNISVESLIVIALLLAVVFIFGRLLSYLLGALVVAFLVVFGLALASDTLTGGNALQQLAEKLTPAIAAIIAAGVGWFKNKQATQT